MLERPNRKQLNRQDVQIPQNIEELIDAYGLNELWAYIDKVVDYINEKEG